MGKDKNAQRASAGHHGESFWKDVESKNSVGLALMQKMGWQKGGGLGKDGQGTAQYVKATQKKDNGGIGAKQSTTDETWLAATSLYNDLLARLNAEAKVTSAEKPKDIDLSEAAEDKSDNIVKRMDAATNGKKLYAKFKKGKDLGNFGAQDIAQILGKKKESTTRSASPSASETSDILTTKASSNISDYFSNKAKAPEPRVVVQPMSGDQGSSKLATLMNNRDRAAGFTEQFQVDYYNTMMGMSHSGRGGLGFGAPPPPQNTRMRFDTDSTPTPAPAAPRTNGTNGTHSAAINGFSAASPLASAFSASGSGLGAGSSMSRSFDPYGHSDDEEDSKSAKSQKDKSKRSNNAVPPPPSDSSSPAPEVEQTESDEERAERKRKKKEAKRRARELAQAAEAEQEAAEVEEAIHDLEQTKSDKKKKKKRKEMDEEPTAEEPVAEEESEEERRKRRKAEKKARKLAEQEAEAAAAEEANGSKRKKSKKSAEVEETPAEEESASEKKKKKKEKKNVD